MVRVTQNESSVNERQAEALSRARTGQSWSNFPAIIQGFVSRGIPESQIQPRENIFTYHAWRALGRQVRKGERGVRVITYIQRDEKTENPDTGEVKVRTYSLPRSVSVFHISQTDERKGASDAAI